MQSWLHEITTDKTQWFLTLLVILLLSLQSQPPVLNACEPWSVNSRSATHSSQTPHLFIINPGSGVTWALRLLYGGECFFSIFKQSLSPSSCLQAAVLADTVQLLCAWHWKHHVVWLKMPSAVKDWGSVYLRGEKPSGRAHIGDKVCTSCGPWNLIAWGLSRLAKSVCCLPWTSCVMKGVTNANEGQSAAVHKATGRASHLVRKEDKLKVPAWFSGDAIAVSFHAV